MDSLKNLFWWFLYTRIGQWLSIITTGGWCFVSKDDSRFFFASDEDALSYDGDEEALPDRGISEQRKQWKTWIVFLMPTSIPHLHVFIDVHDGKRMGCFKKNFRACIAIRAGHESGTIRIGRSKKTGKAIRNEELKIQLLGRWKENAEWLIPQKKDDVTFI